MWKTYSMSTSGLVLTVGVTIMALIDLWFVLFTGTGTTISNFLVNTGYASPPLVFGAGWLCCHLFGGRMYEAKP